MLILDLLLNSHKPRPFIIAKVLGSFFLILGGSMSIYFLYQALIPLIGALESGAIVSTVTTLIGIVLLFLSQKKKESSQKEVAEKTLGFLKGLEIETFLKNKAIPLSLLSLGVGVILSQFKNIKKLSEVYKVFK